MEKGAGSESRKVKNGEIREKSGDKGERRMEMGGGGENEIEEVNEFNYLDFIFQRNGKVEAHIRESDRKARAMREYGGERDGLEEMSKGGCLT